MYLHRHVYSVHPPWTKWKIHAYFEIHYCIDTWTKRQVHAYFEIHYCIETWTKWQIHAYFEIHYCIVLCSIRVLVHYQNIQHRASRRVNCLLFLGTFIVHNASHNRKRHTHTHKHTHTNTHTHTRVRSNYKARSLVFHALALLLFLLLSRNIGGGRWLANCDTEWILAQNDSQQCWHRMTHNNFWHRMTHNNFGTK